MQHAPSKWWSNVRPLLATLAAAGLPLVGVVVLATHGAAIADWLGGQPLGLSMLYIVVAGAVLCGVALLPTHAVSLACGYLFGAAIGPAVGWLSVMGALLIGFLGGRAAAGTGWVDGLAARAGRGGVMASTVRALSIASPRRTAFLIALLRLTPVAPFAATNVALASVGVSRGAMLAGSALGLGPRLAVVAWLGAGMAELDFSKPQSPWLVGLGVVATVAALVVVGRVAQRALRDATATAGPAAG